MTFFSLIYFICCLRDSLIYVFQFYETLLGVMRKILKLPNLKSYENFPH
jgi:hypothetical protein